MIQYLIYMHLRCVFYLKGIRYELSCVAKSQKTTHCVVNKIKLYRYIYIYYIKKLIYAKVFCNTSKEICLKYNEI